ncbi:MAG: E3 binding domain-containing protein, partial [Nocardioidaceae bacterium]
MATVLRMPGVSADSNEAALVEWAVSPGDAVKRGDVVATVETEKAVVDLEAEEDGVLFKTLAAAGESVTIGGPIAVFSQPGEEVDEASILAGLGLGPQASGPLAAEDEERSQDALVPGAEEETFAPEAVPSTTHGNGSAPAGGRIFATPLVRRLAAEAGIALESVSGSGPGGRIRRRDLDAALARQQAAPAQAPAAETAAGDAVT